MAKKTPLHEMHKAQGAKMTEFAGWEMPLSYPSGQIGEHMACRESAALFDVSHMGRLRISGKGALPFLQRALTSNAAGLEKGRAMYSIMANEEGGAIDDVYLYRFEEGSYVLVTNAANHEKDVESLKEAASLCQAEMEDVTEGTAMISLQGPLSREILFALSREIRLEPFKNAAGWAEILGEKVYASRTGYTGEPIGFELFAPSRLAPALWEKLCEAGAKPAGLASRDTLRIEAGLPLYGSEYGTDLSGRQIPVFAFPLAKSAVSFSLAKGPYTGREALLRQFRAFERIDAGDFSDMADLPQRFFPFAVTGKGVARPGDGVYMGERRIGAVSSGTIAPYRIAEGEGLKSSFTGEAGKRAIGFALADSDSIGASGLSVEIRGKRSAIALADAHLRSDAPPYSRPIVFGWAPSAKAESAKGYLGKAEELISSALSNHVFRQSEAINLIPSEMTPSRAVRLLSGLDPSFRYAEHKKLKSFYGEEIFYYQGTGFIGRVEKALNAEMAKFLGARQIESRALSGQMANTVAYSALLSYKNRNRRKQEAERLGYVMNNALAYGGHLSAQPMGALRDYVKIDPETDRRALVNIPVLEGNPYEADVEKAKEAILRYRPELILFGKSMALSREPVREIRSFLDSEGIASFIMYDMAHVLGLAGPLFQEPFAEGADLVTGSTHKTFFGTQRGVLAASFEDGSALWEEVEARAFPGATSNHHLGTMLGLAMAAYEMNEFRDSYQPAVLQNAKSFAKSLAQAGFGVEGDPSRGYTQTHQAIVRVGYAKGVEIASRLEESGIVTNFQQTPSEEGFSAAGALRLGVAEMTRFGFGPEEFAETAQLMADCALKGRNVRLAVKDLRMRHAQMRYCFDEEIAPRLMEGLIERYR
jgi:aminomethyltransferase